jgi:hypothetical protein
MRASLVGAAAAKSPYAVHTSPTCWSSPHPTPCPAVTLNISDVTPLPVELTLDSEPLGKTLFRPLVKVWGGKVAELDGTPTEPRNYDEVASRTQYNWVAR